VISFLRSLTFAKVMIIACLGASAYGVYLVLHQREEIQRITASLETGGTVERLIRSIETSGARYSELRSQQEGDSLRGEESPNTYIATISEAKNIRIGYVYIKPSTRDVTQTVEDQIFAITPRDNTRTYTRTAIANFLWSLEERSRLVRVTQLTIEALNNDPDPKPRVKPEEYPSDYYRISCQITCRRKKGATP